ncbi:MAG TPA: GlsB/YeaQ/YmgE family stress response membrane protein [Longilinea sp.]|nr:GlsB/YeaQ/YmgE family stress response membrane protein [Longilinea sp.]
MNLFSMIVVGIIAGWIGSKIMKSKTGLWVDLGLGVVGAIVGGWISGLITGVNLVGAFNLTSILVAALGAIIVIFVYRLITKNR